MAQGPVPQVRRMLGSNPGIPPPILFMLQDIAREVVSDWYAEWKANESIRAWHVQMVSSTGGLAHMIKQ